MIRVADGSGFETHSYTVHGLRVKIRVWSCFEAIWPRETTTSTPSTDHCLFPECVFLRVSGYTQFSFYLCCNCLAKTIDRGL